MLIINQLTMTSGHKFLFQDVQLNLLLGERYGVVGANGTGKTTFLRLLAQEESPSHGSIEVAKGVSIGILKQDHFRYEQERVVDIVIKGKTLLWKAISEKEALLSKNEISEEECYRLGSLEEIIAHQDGYTAEASAKNILSGLGIKSEYHEGPLSALSGGYKLRVLLAQVLFQNPQILLLDEPTNHLDISSIAWLENFLKNKFKGLLIFVSHDQLFLDNLATCILDIDYGTITEYIGNYTYFEESKKLILSQKEAELSNKNKQIAKIQTYVDRFRASASKARQAQSKLKMIERMEDNLPEISASSRIKPHFNFVAKKRLGKSVLSVEGISKQFNENLVLYDVSFSLQRGEKCAIIGPNGIGKTTLLKILLEKIPANAGKFQWSDTVESSYFAQNYQKDLPLHLTVWQWIESHFNAPSNQMRSILGQVLFTGDDVHKKLSVLSGGELARLIIAGFMIEQKNVLIMDEPTNHLDLESIDALAEALKAYEGTLLLVSHNRYFIDKIAGRIISLTENGAKYYLGNYSAYLEQCDEDYLA